MLSSWWGEGLRNVVEEKSLMMPLFFTSMTLSLESHIYIVCLTSSQGVHESNHILYIHNSKLA